MRIHKFAHSFMDCSRTGFVEASWVVGWIFIEPPSVLPVEGGRSGRSYLPSSP
jgi:hypothetical protein